MREAAGGRWSIDVAQDWHRRQPWFVGANFTPAYAVNQLEMWQAESFDLAAIDRELAMAAAIGMNAVRVFLHDLLWHADPAGLAARLDAYLDSAARHGIGTMFVLFDSCWDPHPELGPQRAPKPGVHNSGWVQGPGMKALVDTAEHDRLQAYVEGVVGRYAGDSRVIVWDIWNEPDNGPEVALCDPLQLQAKADLVVPLLNAAFDWARAAGATQPLTSGIWLGDWSAPDLFSPIQTAQTAQSDVISFHNYGNAADFDTRIKWLNAFGRPLLCTEFMARHVGSTFEAILPVAKDAKVATFCWGLVNGKTQTHLPWDSCANPYPADHAGAWFHDVLDADGVPHDPAEAALIRALTAAR